MGRVTTTEEYNDCVRLLEDKNYITVVDDMVAVWACFSGVTVPIDMFWITCTRCTSNHFCNYAAVDQP